MESLLTLPRPLLVGVSGGSDSVCLLHRLARIEKKGLVVCHFNHQLRAEQSARDEDFVSTLASSLQLPFEGARADIRALAETRKQSVETAAREERYRFFGAVAARYDCRDLVTAHHAGDQAETVLMNLCRGSYGLKAMRPRHEHRGFGLTLWRPLLAVQKAELQDWLTQEGLEWREDQSNAQRHCRRNRIRLEVLPLLNEIFDRDVVPILSRAARQSPQEVGVEGLELASLTDPQGRLFLPKLRLLSQSSRSSVLHWYLTEAGIEGLTERKIRECAELITVSSLCRVNLKGGHALRRKEQRLFIQWAL